MKDKLEPCKRITEDYQIVSHQHGSGDFTEQSNIDTTLAFASGAFLVIVIILATFKHSYILGGLGHEVGSLFFMLVFAAAALIAGSIVHTNRIYQRSELKILDVTGAGIKIGRERFSDEKSYFVPWSKLTALETVQGKRKDGKTENFVMIGSSDGVAFKLRFKNAFAWVDEESFLSQVRSEAPGAALEWNVGRRQLSFGDDRYTNLWLQYFTAPDKRKRRTALSPGTLLQDGLYEVVNRLGGGGQGTAYVARVKGGALLPYGVESQTGLVVLKEYVLPVYRGNALEQQKYELLNQEKDLLCRIDHPQIVKLFDCFIEDHRGYLVQEYIEGENLRERVEKKGPLEPREAARLASSICDILVYLHGMRPPVIHRDITPENLIVRVDGLLKLVDFTVAHQFESSRAASVVGKQAYMPPEQFRGAPLPQSDIYSMGCTLHYLLTGSDPEPMEPSHPARVNPRIGEELDRIVATATAFDTERRYATADEARADLRLYLRKEPGSQII